MAEKTYTTVAVTDNLGNATGDTMQRPSHPDPKKAGIGADACSLCGRTYRRDQIQYYRGQAFGIPCGHYKDIKWYRAKNTKIREERERW